MQKLADKSADFADIDCNRCCGEPVVSKATVPHSAAMKGYIGSTTVILVQSQNAKMRFGRDTFFLVEEAYTQQGRKILFWAKRYAAPWRYKAPRPFCAHGSALGPGPY
jgi:hypothetical protein